MKTTKKKTISVRLDTEAAEIIEELAAQQTNISAYINSIIKSNARINPQLMDKSVLACISEMQTLLEYSDDETLKNEMRKEIDRLCRVLR